MPASNIDHIVTTHRIAAALRAQGKPTWAYRVDIKSIIYERPNDESEENSARVANRVAAALRAGLPGGFFDYANPNAEAGLIEIVESLEQLRADSFADEDDYSALEDLNNRLGDLYDWADIKRVWLGI